MDFTLTDEQQMIKDATRKLMESVSPFESRKEIISEGSFCEEHWNQFADLGLLSIAVPEEYGGLGASPVDIAIMMEEIGRVLLVEPIWAIAVLAAQTLVSSGDHQKCKEILPSLMEGTSRPVLAHNEHFSEGNLSYVTTKARQVSQGKWRINGTKSLIIGGNRADQFLVSARTAGADSDEPGITIFQVPKDAAGLQESHWRLVDNRWASLLTLVDVEVTDANIVGVLDEGFGAIERAHDYAMVGLCAEAIGVMEKALWITRDYLTLRKQFGTTLSSFQSLQHRLAEMLIELELSRSMLFKTLSLFNASATERRLSMSATKTHIGSSGKFICGQAIQLHGGIGVTEEYVIGHYFKRITLIENELGSSNFHLRRLTKQEQQPASVNQSESPLEFPITEADKFDMAT